MAKRWLVFVVLVGVVASLTPGTVAMPSAATMDVAGTYNDGGVTQVRLWAKDRKIGVRTVGLAGEGTVTCTNAACTALGLDGAIAQVRDLDIVLEFKGTDEELQAVIKGRSRANSIFADGFESGDVSAVKGTAACDRISTGGLQCDVVLTLRGGLRGDGARSRSHFTISGPLVLGPAGAGFGVLDWSGSLEIAAR